eukprot:CAMPEP_0176365302 /NCGR_PEP_ID=MMETSP0126-20121128/20367_1 /TAXON_ID=141414 ORGANISM="Strombidinopsis acuminatum, Strain SPMC142" /NCGR_SAMPLE_ID=MMETSP0126 /ASSEMBLY_ACC=CAM_ASM_000229 /LENGTH=65 /DNA_ID=CAMNT_0017722233 /DNA_START=248 /DNA_END=445 /DNA_ORIENTATION=+
MALRSEKDQSVVNIKKTSDATEFQGSVAVKDNDDCFKKMQNHLDGESLSDFESKMAVVHSRFSSD